MKFPVSYKKRLTLTGAAALVLLVACYQLAIRPSVREYNQYKEQMGVRTGVQDPERYWRQLKYREVQIQTLFDQFALDTLNPSKNLLGVVSSYCEAHHVQFREYKPLGQALVDDVTVLTRTIVIEGKFLDCLGLIYELETKKETGRVSSVIFKSYTDPKDKQLRLSCTLFIQNVVTTHENI